MFLGGAFVVVCVCVYVRVGWWGDGATGGAHRACRAAGLCAAGLRAAGLLPERDGRVGERETWMSGAVGLTPTHDPRQATVSEVRVCVLGRETHRVCHAAGGWRAADLRAAAGHLPERDGRLGPHMVRVTRGAPMRESEEREGGTCQGSAAPSQACEPNRVTDQKLIS